MDKNRRNALLDAIDGREIYNVEDGELKIYGFFHHADNGDYEKDWSFIRTDRCTVDADLLRKDKETAVIEAEDCCREHQYDMTADEAHSLFLTLDGDCPPTAREMDASVLDGDGNTLYIDIKPAALAAVA